jgi:UDP-N-acetylmuramoyl-tripeptide--D-alanyl-D-alanine ligase
MISIKSLIDSNKFELGVVKILGEVPISIESISTDSRYILKGDAFLALKGEFFDGFDFVKSCLQKGSELIIYESNLIRDDLILNQYLKEFENVTFIGVKETTLFYQKLSKGHLQNWRKSHPSSYVVGITGTNGKTTAKTWLGELLSHILPEKVLMTQKNFNNHLGVPKTLLQLKDHHEVLVLEIGTNHPGEIEVLCQLIMPNAGIFTSLGPGHIENFGSIEKIFLEKKVLYDYVMRTTDNNGLFITDGDNDFLKTLPKNQNVYFIENEICEIKDDHLKFNIQNVNPKIQGIVCNPNIFGKHNYKNLAYALLMSYLICPNQWEELLDYSQKYLKPVDNRSNWISYKEKTIYLDAYNANPSSMEASIILFNEKSKRDSVSIDDQVYILGDMNELGEFAKEYHSKMGLLLNTLKVKNVIFIGRYAEFYSKGFNGEQNCKIFGVFKNREEFQSTFSTLVISKSLKNFFIKASRSLQLEKLLES